MKRLLIILMLVMTAFLLQGQGGAGWKYTPLLQSDITTVSNYLRVNLGVIRLLNPLEPGQVILSKWMDGQLVFQNQLPDFERFILQKASPTTLGGVKIDGQTITMNADSVISAVIPEQQAGVDSIFTTLHPTLPIEYLQYRKQALTYGVTSIQQPGGLFTGGVVTWLDSLRFSVSPSGYYINGKLYTSEQTTLELAPSDQTYGRIDLIAVDSLSRVMIIQGEAAENPQKPIVDPASQLELTQVLILPNAVTPEGPGVIRDLIVYDENTEWTGSSQGVTVNFANTAQVTPFHGTTCTSTGAIGMEDRVIFTSPVTVTALDYETLSFAIRLKATATTRNSLYLEFYLNGARVSNSSLVNFDHSNALSWQNLSVPVSGVTFSSPTFNSVHFRWIKTGSGADFTGFYLDYVKLQAGVTQPVAQGQVELVGDVTGKGISSIVATVVDDSHSHTTLTLPTLISSLEGVTNDGGNIDLLQGNNIQITPDDALNRITIAVSPLDTTDIGGLNEYVLDRIPQTATVDTSLVAGLNEYVLDRIPVVDIDTTEVAGLNEYVLDRLVIPQISIDTTDVAGLNQYVLHRQPATHNPVTINPASSALASINASQVLTITPPATAANLTVQALSGTTVTWNAQSGINATLTLSGNTTITLSNLMAGTSGNIVVTNPATMYSLTFAGYTNRISPAVYSALNVVKTSGSGKTDCYSWYYDGTRLLWNGTLDYN